MVHTVCLKTPDNDKSGDSMTPVINVSACHNYWLGRTWSLIIVFALLYIQIQVGNLYSVLAFIFDTLSRIK